MDKDIRLAMFLAIEIILLVTPMMWPTIPQNIGIAAYAVAAALALYAGIAGAIDLRLRKRNSTIFGWPFLSLQRNAGEPPQPGQPQQSQAPQDIQTFPDSVLIADLKMNFGRLGQPSPWLDFHGIGFNGSDHTIEVLAASGRVRVAGVDFPAELELYDAPIVVEAHNLFAFALNLPVNESGAKHILHFTHGYQVLFFKAGLVFQLKKDVINPEMLPRYNASLPKQIAFARSGGTGEPQPHYLNQVINL